MTLRVLDSTVSVFRDTKFGCLGVGMYRDIYSCDIWNIKHWTLNIEHSLPVRRDVKGVPPRITIGNARRRGMVVAGHHLRLSRRGVWGQHSRRSCGGASSSFTAGQRNACARWLKLICKVTTEYQDIGMPEYGEYQNMYGVWGVILFEKKKKEVYWGWVKRCKRDREGRTMFLLRLLRFPRSSSFFRDGGADGQGKMMPVVLSTVAGNLGT